MSKSVYELVCVRGGGGGGGEEEGGVGGVQVITRTPSQDMGNNNPILGYGEKGTEFHQAFLGHEEGHFRFHFAATVLDANS